MNIRRYYTQCTVQYRDNGETGTRRVHTSQPVLTGGMLNLGHAVVRVLSVEAVTVDPNA